MNGVIHVWHTAGRLSTLVEITFTKIIRKIEKNTLTKKFAKI